MAFPYDLHPFSGIRARSDMRDRRPRLPEDGARRFTGDPAPRPTAITIGEQVLISRRESAHRLCRLDQRGRDPQSRSGPEPSVRAATGSDRGLRPPHRIVEVDACWSYWLDDTGQKPRLRISPEAPASLR